jgi:hypothetical protein
MSTPSTSRIVLALDGCIKANFSDNSVLTLSPTGMVFVITHQDGHQQRQLSEFALNRHAAALAVVMEFRNLHVDKPCFCHRLNRVMPR